MFHSVTLVRSMFWCTRAQPLVAASVPAKLHSERVSQSDRGRGSEAVKGSETKG